MSQGTLAILHQQVQLPLHWWIVPLRLALQKVVRPPTATTRRRQRVVQAQIPMEGFIHLMQCFATGEVEGLTWTDDARGALEPTRVTKLFREYQFWLRKPEHLNRFWNMERWDRPIAGTPWRRGCGSQTLHLSQVAGRRGQTSLLVSSVAGNVSIRFREPEHLMPTVRIVFTVMTLSNNHALWNQDFCPRTRGALRNMAQAGRQKMIADPLYPTPADTSLLTAHPQTDELWQPIFPALTQTQTALTTT